MTTRQELLEIPQALRQMSEEGRRAYDAIIRSASWSQRPVFMIGDGASYFAALTGAWAFESLLGLPVIVRRPAVFSAYTRHAIAVHSLVIAISSSSEGEETLQAVKNAKRHGAVVWVISPNPESELAELADAVADCYAAESPAEGSRSVFCRHAATLFLAVAAAQVLKAPAPMLNTQEGELGKLATNVEWILNRISDAGSALAKELGQLSDLYIVGGGSFHPVALQAASRLRQLAGVNASGFDLMHFQQDFRQISQPGAGILYLSSSRCRLKEQAHRSVAEFRQMGGQKLFAVTDNNDRQLSQRSDLAVLLPGLTEAGGALLTLAFLELAVSYASQDSTHAAALRRPASKG